MSHQSDEIMPESYTNLLAGAGLYDEMEADLERREIKADLEAREMEDTLPALQYPTLRPATTEPERVTTVPATVENVTVSATSAESEESAVGIPLRAEERIMVLISLIPRLRIDIDRVDGWVNGIEANPTLEAELGQAALSSPFSPFQTVPRPVTAAEMERFANELNGFVFVFGCPAAGKGTLLGRLAGDPELAHAHLYHLSIGDHLRELRERGTLPVSASQDLAQQNLLDGATLVAIIKKKVATEWQNGSRIFLLDGFPRNGEQMAAFLDKHICSLAIHVDTEKRVANRRYLARRGRDGGDAALFEKRYAEFARNNGELIARFREEGKLVTVGRGHTGLPDREMVYEGFKAGLKRHHIGAQLFQVR